MKKDEERCREKSAYKTGREGWRGGGGGGRMV